MKLVGFENWINVILATLDNISFHYGWCKHIYSFDNKQNADTMSLIYTHIRTRNIVIFVQQI